MKTSAKGRRYSTAEKTGGAALLLALVLGWLAPPLMAALPLALFLVVCLVAPFFPRSSFFLPVLSTASPGNEGIALTFDDGPFPESTLVLLELLARHNLPATFFVTGRNAAAYPELIEAIVAHKHTIGNHSLCHDNLLMLRSSRALSEDIRATQDILANMGIRALLFRPPVGITNPRLGPVLARLGLQAVTFSCRVHDRGNRNIDNLAARVLQRLRPGEILLLHDNPPRTKKNFELWYRELNTLFSSLRQTYRVMPLADLINTPVMVPLKTLPVPSPHLRSDNETFPIQPH